MNKTTHQTKNSQAEEWNINTSFMIERILYFAMGVVMTTQCQAIIDNPENTTRVDEFAIVVILMLFIFGIRTVYLVQKIGQHKSTVRTLYSHYLENHSQKKR